MFSFSEEHQKREEKMTQKSMDFPEECWELIFSFLPHEDDIFNNHLETLSLVCKQFLSITNKLRVSLTVSALTASALSKIIRRFPQLKHVDLQHFHGDPDGLLLLQIAESGLDLESLNLSNQKRLPTTGCRILGLRMQNLRALNCSKVGSLVNSDLNLISDYFPHLEELDISYPNHIYSRESSFRSTISSSFSSVLTDSGIIALSSRLKHLRKVNFSGNPFVTDTSLVEVSRNCNLLREITVRDCDFITERGIALALRQSPNLRSISANIFVPAPYDTSFVQSLVCLKDLSALDLSRSLISNQFLYNLAAACLPLKKLVLSQCGFESSALSILLDKNRSIEYLDLEAAYFLTDESIRDLSTFLPRLTSINLSCCSRLTDSTLFTLSERCPMLSEIRMGGTNLGSEETKTTFIVNPQVKNLNLSRNKNLCSKSINNFAYMFPNLKLLKLNYNVGITGDDIVQVLKKCPKIKHLEINHAARITNFVIDFELPAMEVLEIRGLRIDDAFLAMIGRRCPNLLSLGLSSCVNVSRGVVEVVRKCRRLREIDLRSCNNVDPDSVALMVFSRPSSLRKIVSPHPCFPTERQKSIFLNHGCLVLTEEDLDGDH